MCALVLITVDEVNKILQTYTLEEILECNEYTEEELVLLLINEMGFNVPKPEPLQ